MRIFLFALALCFSLPAEAKHARALANSGEKLVLGFHCNRSDSGELTAVGLASLTPSNKDRELGNFSVSLHLKNRKSPLSKSLQGTYTTVPEGVILRTPWESANKFTLIHLHPAEATRFPGVEGNHACEIDQKLE